MKTLHLKNNTEDSPIEVINVTGYQYEDLLQLQYKGGFKRFEMDIYSESKKRTTAQDTEILTDFLSRVFLMKLVYI
jgi:hypothetical protein